MFARFWASHGRTDLTMSFYVKFCFRWTSSEVCTTKNRFRPGSRIPDPRSGTEPISGRTDLRIGPSKAKFDVEAHGGVRLPMRRPKPRENHKKLVLIQFCFPIFFVGRRKMKCWESSETRSRKFSRRSGPSLRRKRPSKVPIEKVFASPRAEKNFARPRPSPPPPPPGRRQKTISEW